MRFKDELLLVCVYLMRYVRDAPVAERSGRPKLRSNEPQRGRKRPRVMKFTLSQGRTNHGGPVEISSPDLLHSRKAADFGVGFYCFRTEAALSTLRFIGSESI